MAILLLAGTFLPSFAQSVSVNYDESTIAAMAESFAAEYATELLYREQVDKVLEHYQSAETGLATVYAGKYLERLARKELGLWCSDTENYYYQRIRSLVVKRLIPKLWAVGTLLLDSPQSALYWCPYLMIICADTKVLCMQFEQVVTNGTLSFSDVPFVELSSEVVSLFDVSSMGGVDWQSMLEDFAAVSGNFNTDVLAADLDRLYQYGSLLVRSGVTNVRESFLQQSAYASLFDGKWLALISLYEHYSGLFEQLDTNLGNTLLEMLGGADGVQSLFALSQYDVTSWLTDYLQSSDNTYYTQRWYIYCEATEEEVYEAVFDSYSMDEAAFQAQLSVLVEEYNDNEDSLTYALGSDAKKYYTAGDEAKMSGCEMATISVTCTDSVVLAEGSTQYKCNSCGSSVNSHTLACAMLSSVDEADFDTSELEEMLAAKQASIEALEADIAELEAANQSLLSQIADATLDEVADLRAQYYENLGIIADLEEMLAEEEAELAEIEAAIEALEEGEAEATDDYYRIPAIMSDCKTAYSLTWTDEGAWSGTTFIRHASHSYINGQITFAATVSIARKPKYVLGVKIHRAIVQISWTLSSVYSETTVVEELTFSGESDEEKAEMVNERLSAVAKAYPECTVTVDYAYGDSVEEESDDVYHLLWSSDRLDIARQVNSRVTKIYADLVCLEKMLHYKRDLLDVLRDVGAGIDWEADRKRSIADSCRVQWMRRVKSEE